MIEVYHGSNISVQKPSLSFGRSDADFGCGFYISTKLEMAEKWACRKKTPIISKYTLDLQGLEIYEFSLDAEWLEFVIDNRFLKHHIFSQLMILSHLRAQTQKYFGQYFITFCNLVDQ